MGQLWDSLNSIQEGKKKRQSRFSDTPGVSKGIDMNQILYMIRKDHIA